MSVIIVRASDSGLAMQEITRRLGEDAYILSTKRHKGQVEVRASLTPPIVPAKPVTPKPELRAVRDSDTAPPAKTGTFEHMLNEVHNQNAGSLPGPGAGYLEVMARRLLPDDPGAICNAQRILIVGPPGSGKTMLAVRIAAHKMTDDPNVRPVLVAPRRHKLTMPDALTTAARLMGLHVERPLHQDDITIADPAFGQPCIYDLDDADPDVATALVTPETQVVLCLPSGLHPLRIERICAKWSALNPVVCLTGLDEWTPSADEFGTLAASSLTWGLGTRSAGLIDALFIPQRSDLFVIAQTWRHAPQEARL